MKLKNDVAHGAVVRWSDVEIDANNDTVKTRQGDGSGVSAYARP